MKVTVPKHFVDEFTQHLIGRGEHEVKHHVAERWISKGKAAPVDEESGQLADKINAGKPAEVPGAGTDNISPPANPTPLPDDFPERGRLIAAGFTSMESLHASDAADKIGKIEGITKAAVTKIGLALDKK